MSSPRERGDPCESSWKPPPGVAGFDIVWEGSDADEIGVDRRSGRVLVTLDPKYWRPAEVDLLLGNAAKAERSFGWKARIGFEKLVEIMMCADMALLGVCPVNSGRKLRVIAAEEAPVEELGGAAVVARPTRRRAPLGVAARPSRSQGRPLAEAQ